MYMSENDQLLEKLFDELVPRSGKAESLAGELVRATMRLSYRFYNDGDRIDVGYGKETCNAAARFLLKHADDAVIGIVQKLWKASTYDSYQHHLDCLVGAVAKYVNDHPELRKQETEDMFNYFDPNTDREPDDDENF